MVTMKVKELIKLFSGLDQEATVRLAVKGGGMICMYKAEIKTVASSLDRENTEEYLIGEGTMVEHLSWHDVMNIGWTEPD